MTQAIIMIGGPTASGKSGLAIRLAKALRITQNASAVIINADSAQVYRDLPILTAQPAPEEQQGIPHLLFGFLPVASPCSAGIWLECAVREISAAWGEGRIPVVTGGTGLYLKSLAHGLAAIPSIPLEVRARGHALLKEAGNAAFHGALSARDPVMGARLKPGDTQRILRAWEVLEHTGKSLAWWQEQKYHPPFPGARILGFRLMPPRDIVYGRCNARFLSMLERGALEEARKFAADAPAAKILGLRELAAHLRGECSLEEAVTHAQRETRRYAKRQYTWFRHQFPEFVELDGADDAALVSACKNQRLLFASERY